MIRLRELKVSDAPYMLEWMHDPYVQRCFRKDMLGITLEQAQEFCRNSVVPSKLKTGDDIHFAIVDENDEYLGTISLKKVDLENKKAEYAVTTRQKTRGTGAAFKATGDLLKKAFREYGLHRVYLNVFADNQIAIKFYEKCGFKYEGEFREHLLINQEYKSWKWYGILDSEYNEGVFEIE